VTSNGYDIALIKLRDKVTLDENVQLACIPDDIDVQNISKFLKVGSFGYGIGSQFVGRVNTGSGNGIGGNSNNNSNSSGFGGRGGGANNGSNILGGGGRGNIIQPVANFNLTLFEIDYCNDILQFVDDFNGVFCAGYCLNRFLFIF
jgi:hypothetical protein